MLRMRSITSPSGTVVFHDPPIAQFLFGNTKLALVWLVIRLYVGYSWLDAGWHKFTDPRWFTTGEALRG